jgi:hypothetical protein
MKFGYGWTFVNKPRGETPAPPPDELARHYRPAGLPAEFELGRPTQLARFRLLEGFKNWF